MLTTIKGYYEDGQIILKEEPPVTDKTEVMITFLTEEASTKSKKKIPVISKQKILVSNRINKRTKEKRKLGGLKGKVTIPDDFNEPLEDLKEYM